jgi:hypothetical protein
VPTVMGWGGPDGSVPTITDFHQFLGSSFYNWVGRQITETFPKSPVDACWFSDSIFAKASNNPAAPFFVTGNQGYFDYIGTTPAVINYYRKAGRAPSDITFSQTMVISCTSGRQPYKTNVLTIGVGLTTVGNSRGQVVASEFWGAPAPSVTLAPVITLLLTR